MTARSRARSAVGATILALVTSSVWCAGGGAVTEPATTSTASAAAPSSATAPEAASAAKPPPPPRVLGPDDPQIACGQSPCIAGKELCCALHVTDPSSPDVGKTITGCAPLPAQPVRTSDAETDDQMLLDGARRLQEKACEELLGDLNGSLDVDSCDDSGDCPDAFVCCSDYFDYGRHAKTCRPANADGTLACWGQEACSREGASCATNGGVCLGVECGLEKRRISCGKKECDGSCCFDGATPTCAGSCSKWLECTSPTDCLGGAQCCLYVSPVAGPDGSPDGLRSHCAGVCYYNEKEQYVCDKHADCPDMYGPKACKPSLGGLLKTCGGD